MPCIARETSAAHDSGDAWRRPYRVAGGARIEYKASFIYVGFKFNKGV
jgi:hypothetical protein